VTYALRETGKPDLAAALEPIIAAAEQAQPVVGAFS
jgi:hypothetical protein